MTALPVSPAALASLSDVLPGAAAAPAGGRRAAPDDHALAPTFSATLETAAGALEDSAPADVRPDPLTTPASKREAKASPSVLDAIALLLAGTAAPAQGAQPLPLARARPLADSDTALPQLAGVLDGCTAAGVDAVATQPGKLIPGQAQAAPAAPAHRLPAAAPLLATAAADSAGPATDADEQRTRGPSSPVVTRVADAQLSLQPLVAAPARSAAATLSGAATPDGAPAAVLATPVPTSPHASSTASAERFSASGEPPRIAQAAVPAPATAVPAAAGAEPARHSNLPDEAAPAADIATVPTGSAHAVPRGLDGPTSPPAAQVAPAVGSSGWAPALAQQVLRLRPGREVELHLNPADLGPLKVTLSLANSQAHVQFASEHAGVRHALETALPQLRASFADSGISLGQATVGSGSGESSGWQGEPSARDAAPAGEASRPAPAQAAPAPVVPPRARSGIDTFA